MNEEYEYSDESFDESNAIYVVDIMFMPTNFIIILNPRDSQDLGLSKGDSILVEFNGISAPFCVFISECCREKEIILPWFASYSINVSRGDKVSLTTIKPKFSTNIDINYLDGAYSHDIEELVKQYFKTNSVPLSKQSIFCLYDNDLIHRFEVVNIYPEIISIVDSKTTITCVRPSQNSYCPKFLCPFGNLYISHSFIEFIKGYFIGSLSGALKALQVTKTNTLLLTGNRNTGKKSLAISLARSLKLNTRYIDVGRMFNTQIETSTQTLMDFFHKSLEMKSTVIVIDNIEKLVTDHNFQNTLAQKAFLNILPYMIQCVQKSNNHLLIGITNDIPAAGSSSITKGFAIKFSMPILNKDNLSLMVNDLIHNYKISSQEKAMFLEFFDYTLNPLDIEVKFLIQIIKVYSKSSFIFNELEFASELFSRCLKLDPSFNSFLTEKKFCDIDISEELPENKRNRQLNDCKIHLNSSPEFQNEIIQQINQNQENIEISLNNTKISESDQTRKVFNQDPFGQPTKPVQANQINNQNPFGQSTKPVQANQFNNQDPFGQPTNPTQTYQYGNPNTFRQSTTPAPTNQFNNQDPFGQPTNPTQTYQYGNQDTFRQPTKPVQVNQINNQDPFGQPTKPVQANQINNQDPFGQQTRPILGNVFNDVSSFGNQSIQISYNEQRKQINNSAPFGQSNSPSNNRPKPQEDIFSSFDPFK